MSLLDSSLLASQLPDLSHSKILECAGRKRQLSEVDFLSHKQAKKVFDSYFELAKSSKTFQKTIMRVQDKPSLNKCRKFVKDCLLNWNSHETLVLKEIFQEIKQKLIKKEIDLTLKKVTLIKATGAEINYRGIYYCGSSIVLLKHGFLFDKLGISLMLYRLSKQLASLLGITKKISKNLTEQLFHLFCTQNKAKWHQFLQFYQFYPMPKYDFPEEIRKILVHSSFNEDRVYFSFLRNGAEIKVTPIEVYDRTGIYAYKNFLNFPYRNGLHIPRYQSVRWLQVLEVDETYIAVRSPEGKATYLEEKDIPLPSFMKNQYFTHPNEVFAKIFCALVWDEPSLDYPKEEKAFLNTYFFS